MARVAGRCREGCHGGGLIVGVGGRVSLKKRGQNQRRQPKIVDTFPWYCGTISIIEVEP